MQKNKMNQRIQNIQFQEIKSRYKLRYAPTREIVVILLLFLVCMGLNFIAHVNLFQSPLWVFFFYHFLMGLIIGIILPIWYVVIYNNGKLLNLGLTLKNWRIAVIIGIIFVLCTLPFRLFEYPVSVPANSLVLFTSIALTFSTMFEEIFFRGIVQTRFENAFGMIPAIIISALFYSLYHVGYGGIYLEFSQLLKLFFVGLLFAIPFSITRNVITSFIVNYPHALITFLLMEEYFKMNSAIFSFIIISLVLIWILYIKKKDRSNSSEYQ